MEELEKRDLIVFHDDQQGIAIAVLAALFNALNLVGKKLEKARICLGGSGAGGYGIFKILNYIGLKNIIVFDIKGIIFRSRKEDNKYQKEIAKFTNKENLKGGLKEAIKGSDVFIGVTGKAGLLNSSNIKQMRENPIIFAISNPKPEILPREIEKATKDYIYAAGRPDYPNQINNVLVFPGVFKGLLKTRKRMNLELEFKIAKAIASLIKNPTPSYIVPSTFDKRLVKTIVACIKEK
jgi:malate dehydrogenase (oxaloacetate-decarboxylating)